MPLTHFICPDNTKIPIQTCLGKCPNPDGRCLSLPTLYSVSEQRTWAGKPSTTQLLKGTRQAYLEIIRNYATCPKDFAFALLGTRHHRKLDLAAKSLGMKSELVIFDEETTGILDLLEPDDLNPGQFILIDYKTWGSYAVAKSLGMKSRNGDVDMLETELQLNHYRVKISKTYPISRMLVQATVRDGNTRSARENGIDGKIYLIPVKTLDDDDVIDYFTSKAEALLSALNTKTMPDKCTYNEMWGGRRCNGYCLVAEHCDVGRKFIK